MIEWFKEARNLKAERSHSYSVCVQFSVFVFRFMQGGSWVEGRFQRGMVPSSSFRILRLRVW